MVIGKGGAEIEKLRAAVEAMIGKKVALNIVEVRSADMDAQLVAENIAQQLEKRISFRRAMKNAMGRAMRAGAKGIKSCCSGRLGGARDRPHRAYHEGTIPLQTIRADIDYGFAEAATTYGRIGVKVWIYKGEVLSQTLRTTPRTMDTASPISATTVAVTAATAIAGRGGYRAVVTATARATAAATAGRPQGDRPPGRLQPQEGGSR